jgi:hypothetical protein
MSSSNIILCAQKSKSEKLQLEDVKAYTDFVAQAPPGRYVIEIKRSRPPKSQKQLGVIFGLMIGSIIEQMEEQTLGVEDLMKYLLTADIPKGQHVTKDYLHALFYILAPTFDDEGKQVTLSKMNTLQAKELIERVQNIMAPFGVVIPDPDPNWNK